MFLNGTNATTIQGSRLDGLEGFTFNFTSSNLNADVTANGTWTFNGTTEQTESALEKAGYHNYWEDAGNILHFGMKDFRSHGDSIGDGSGHFAVQYDYVATGGEPGITKVTSGTVPTTGDVHFGENNPYVSFRGFQKHVRQVKRSILP